MNRDLLYSKKFIVFQKKLLNRLLKQGWQRITKEKKLTTLFLEAEKKAAQEATEQGKTALEIESAKKAAREAIEKSKQGEIAAAAAAKTQEYDLMKVIDTEKD